MNKLFSEGLSGIPLGAWQRFLKIFSENKTQEEKLRSLETGIRAIIRDHAPPEEGVSERTTRRILDHIASIVELSQEK